MEASALEGHLKLCAAGGRSGDRPFRKAPFGAGKRWDREKEGEKDTQTATRHDPDFKNESLHKKKWAGVLEEEEEGDGPGLVPEYDPVRGGIRLSLYTGVGGYKGDFEECLPAEAGSLGGGIRFSAQSSRFSRASSEDPSPGSAFWAKHEQRRRAEDREFAQGARAFERMRSERMQREAEESERAERRREEEERARVRALHDAEETKRAMAQKRKAAASYDAEYQAFEDRAKAKAPVAYDAIPWPAKGGSAEFVIGLHASKKDLSQADRRRLVLQWSRRWHPDTWARLCWECVSGGGRAGGRKEGGQGGGREGGGGCVWRNS